MQPSALLGPPCLSLCHLGSANVLFPTATLLASLPFFPVCWTFELLYDPIVFRNSPSVLYSRALGASSLYKNMIIHSLYRLPPDSDQQLWCSFHSCFLQVRLELQGYLLQNQFRNKLTSVAIQLASIALDLSSINTFYFWMEPNMIVYVQLA